MPSTLALMRSTFTDDKERTFAVGVWSAMGAAGAAAGPLVGGILLEHFWWGSVFLVNVPIMALVLIIGLPTLRESMDPNPGPMDPLSVALSLVGILAFVYSVKEVATHGVEVSYLAIGVVGVGALIWFVQRQRTLEEHPLIDVRLFSNAPFTGAVLGMILSVFGLAGSLFFFSQYLQFVKGLSPLQARLFKAPATLGALVGAGGPTHAVIRSRASDSGGPALHRDRDGRDRADPRQPSFPGVRTTPDHDRRRRWRGPHCRERHDSGRRSTRPGGGGSLHLRDRLRTRHHALGIALLGSILTAVYQQELRLPARLDKEVRAATIESPGGAFEAAPGLPASLQTSLLDAVHIAFRDAMISPRWLSTCIIVIGAVVTWYLLPGKLDKLEEMSAH